MLDLRATQGAEQRQRLPLKSVSGVGKPMARMPRHRPKSSPVSPAPSDPSHGSATSLPQLLTVEELAPLLKVTKAALYALVERGKVPRACIVRLGRSLRFRSDQVTIWLQGDHGGKGIP